MRPWLWLSPRCHYGRLESVTVLHLPNAVINSRDMGPIVSSPVMRCDVGYYPATSKLWEHSWHLVRCNTLVITVSNIGSDTGWGSHLISNYFQLDPMELNNTRKAKREILFFNRVPKVGSQTTMELLKQLSVKNHFHYHKDKTQKVEQIKLPYSKEVSTLSKFCQNVSKWAFQKWLANFLEFLKPPSAYVKHVNFVNCPQWVNFFIF